MSQPTPREIAVIGPGIVGQAFATLLQRAGHVVTALGGRHAARTEAAARKLEPPVRACTMDEAALSSDLVLVAVRDDAIAAVADACCFRRNATVIHFSGALTSDVLAPARERFGCHAASMHPLQTFPSVEQGLATLPGCTCFVEGDDVAVRTALALAEDLGMRSVRINKEAKALYHAAAVMGCNYLCALMHATGRTARAAGIPEEEFRTAFMPLVKHTLENIRANGPVHSLTGPIARGDAETVRRHLQALETLPPEQALYAALGRYTLELARQQDPSMDRTLIREAMTDA